MNHNPSITVTPLDITSSPFITEDPFLFCVYHNDSYPAGDQQMQAPRRGNGHDFDPQAPYRMYHGDHIPGYHCHRQQFQQRVHGYYRFPQHPHRGFETLTVMMEGTVDHTDSLGGSGRYSDGDMQWLTAGRGILHGENFPLINQSAPNPLRLFQIWLNLSPSSKMAEPKQMMFWAESIPKSVSDDGRSTVRVLVGQFGDVAPLPPPPDSWAADPAHDVAVWFMTIAPGGSVRLPSCAAGVNRLLYFITGDGITVADRSVNRHSVFRIPGGTGVDVRNSGTQKAEALILQGQPINEPVHQHGPFVMNSEQEIQTAISDYSKTRFGGWPWQDNAVVFPPDKGRFVSVNGVVEYPPGHSSS